MPDTETIAQDTGVTTEKTGSDNSADSGEVAPEGSQGQQGFAGESQDSSEGGREQGTDTRRQPFRSKNRTIWELRQQVRERDGQIQSIQQRLDEFEQKFQSRGQERKPSRTFWEAPEESVRELTRAELQELKKELIQEMRSTREQDQQSAAWQSETSEATKFIRSQKGFTEDDFDLIEEIVRETPEMRKLTPMQRAKYALYLFREEKGISDKTGIKQRAAAVSGAPPTTSGVKVWTEAEIERELNKLPQDPRSWTEEQNKQYQLLDAEFRNAYREGRVKK